MGYPLYNYSHEKISITIGNKKDDEWPPEKITQLHGVRINVGIQNSHLYVK